MSTTAGLGPLVALIEKNKKKTFRTSTPVLLGNVWLSFRAFESPFSRNFTAFPLRQLSYENISTKETEMFSRDVFFKFQWNKTCCRHLCTYRKNVFFGFQR